MDATTEAEATPPHGHRLRLLRPVQLMRRGIDRRGSALFWIGVLAILLQFFITRNLVAVVWRDVNIRVHPATFIVFGCAVYALLSGVVPFHQRCRDAPTLVLFVFGIPLLAVYAAFFNGFSGTAFYIDSFWAPSLLAVLLEPASDKQKRLLGRILLFLIVMNVMIGLIESITHNNWFPFIMDDDGSKHSGEQAVDDFRANAFYGHPLTASLITSMGFFLLYRMNLRFIFAAPIFGVMMIGLLEFGGRTALGVTIIVSVVAAFYVFIAGIIRRDLKLDFVLAIIAGAIIIPLLVGVVVTQTTIADRIIDTLYFDDSAQVRTMQWAVLRWLSLKNWLFGIPLQELEILKFQIGLDANEDIENFWLLLFLNLGAIGFIAFLYLFGSFLIHIARFGGGMNGWLLMLSALVIDSGSNSLGQKSNDLFIEVAMLAAMAGFYRYTRQPRSRFAPQLKIPRIHSGISHDVLPPKERPGLSRNLRTLRRG